MTNRERYLDEISNQTPDYKITIADFITWLITNDEVKDFRHYMYLTTLGNDPDDWNEYDIAVDYSIPIAMVRWFKKVLF